MSRALAVRISAGVLVALAAGATLAWYLLRGATPGEKRPGVATAAGPHFRDATPESGIAFRFRADVAGAKRIATLGAGVSLADVNGDGALDVLFVQQVRNARTYRESGRTQPLADCARLFVNRGDGTFDDTTRDSGLSACGWGVSALFADLDNDGDPDLVVGNAGGESTVWRNDGRGAFGPVKDTGLPKKVNAGMTALEANGDGIPDLFLGHFLDTDPDREAASGAWKAPGEYAGGGTTLLGGKGDLTFVDVTEPAGARVEGAGTIGVVAFDFDGDRWTDVFAANTVGKSALLRNGGGGSFRAAFLGRGVESHGIASGDLDGDGTPDLFVTGAGSEPGTLFRNVESAMLVEVPPASFAGGSVSSAPVAGFGVVAIDHDDDGREDLAVSTGPGFPPDAASVPAWLGANAEGAPGAAGGERIPAHRQILYRNESEPGKVSFRDVSAAALGDLAMAGRGLAAGDLDGDGRLDLVFAPVDRGAVVLENGTKGGRSFELLPVAGADRKSVLGTRVTVNGRTKEFQIVPSYAGGSWQPLHFGLGEKAAAHVRIVWPDRSESVYEAAPPGSYRLRKGSPTLTGPRRELGAPTPSVSSEK